MPPFSLASVSHISIQLFSPSETEIPVVLGAKVIAAAGTQEKLDISVKYGGADYAVDYTKSNWQKEVMKITGGKGVDVVYDPVGMIKGRIKFPGFVGIKLN